MVNGEEFRAVVVSTDEEFRDTLRSLLESDPEPVSVAVEIRRPFPEIADPELHEIREVNPDIVFLDLEESPHVGLKFAEFLLDAGLTRALVGAGRDLAPDFLLSAMQSGILEFLRKPLEPGDVRDAVDRVWRKTGRRTSGDSRREAGELFAVFSPKGGTGATTISTNLAIELHRLSRKKTLLVDLDLELGETALLLGMEPRFSIVDLVQNFHRVDSGLLASYIERHESGLELLSAPYEPVSLESFEGERIQQILQFLKAHYEYVVLDVPKTFNPTTRAALEKIDRLFLVTTATLPSLRNLSRCLPLLQQLLGQPMERWGRLVVNRYDAKRPVEVRDIEETLGMEVSWTLKNDYDALMEAVNQAEPAVLLEKSSYALDVRRMAADLTGVSLDDRGRGGLLKRVVRSLVPGRDGSDADSAEVDSHA